MANFITNEYKLDITPQGNYPVVYLSQFENGRQIKFIMMNRGRVFTIPSGLSASISGVKSNGGYYEHICTFDSRNVYVPVEDDMVDVSGRGVSVIKFTDGDGDVVVSAKFVVNVQETPSDSGIEIPTAAETILQQILLEIRTKIAEVNTHINELDASYQDFIDDADDRMTTHENNVNDKIGNTSMGTIATTITGAIREIKDDVSSRRYIVKTFGPSNRLVGQGEVSNITFYPLSVLHYRAVGVMSYKIEPTSNNDNTYKNIRVLSFDIDKDNTVGTLDVSFYNTDSNDMSTFLFTYVLLYIREDLIDFTDDSSNS